MAVLESMKHPSDVPTLSFHKLAPLIVTPQGHQGRFLVGKTATLKARWHLRPRVLFQKFQERPWSWQPCLKWHRFLEIDKIKKSEIKPSLRGEKT